MQQRRGKPTTAPWRAGPSQTLAELTPRCGYRWKGGSVKTMLRMLLFAGMASAAALSAGAAQSSREAALVTIPFRFIVADKLLPAGTYQIWSESSDWEMMNIASEGSRSVAASVRTWPAPNPAPGGSKVHVQFKNYCGQYFLQWVQLPLAHAHEVKITTAQAQQTLTRLNLMPAEFGSVASCAAGESR
jgi:hypothetical protein